MKEHPDNPAGMILDQIDLVARVRWGLHDLIDQQAYLEWKDEEIRRLTGEKPSQSGPR